MAYRDELIVRPVLCLVVSVVAGAAGGLQAVPAAIERHKPTAPTVASNFRVGSPRIRLHRRCKREAVRDRLLATLTSFNTGRGTAFAANFVSRMVFVPYDGTPLSPRGGMYSRASVARFARQRHVAGDGWTSHALLPPVGGAGIPASAVYTVILEVLIDGHVVAPRSVKVVVACASGLIRNWVGPRVPA